MALVSYDYGSDSDGACEEEEENIHATAPKNLLNNHAASQSQICETETTRQDNKATPEVDHSAGSMFSSLPKSLVKTSVNSNEDEIEDFIPKAPKVQKKREKVKITIPALSEYGDDSDNDEPIHKKTKRTTKGSGLIGMLPPVKSEPVSTRSFIPKSVAQKATKPLEQSSVKSKPLIPDSVKKKQINNSTMKSKNANKEALESDDEDDVVIPETFDEEMWQKVCGREQKKPVYQEPVQEQPQDINIAPEPIKPYEGLDNAAFKELVGKKRKEQNINIIDIHESDILPDKDVWMMKAITDPECVPKTAVENPVDPTRRRKHHITYLAEQAKANEQELQNQWAANKFSRNQTRAKYGF